MFFLAIQNTYTHLEIALMNGLQQCDVIQEDKMYASKNFVIMIDMLLRRNSIKLSSLAFCAINRGPSPFTTLRSVIASVNGLHFALNIPLIGIDGLEALFLEYQPQLADNSLILLNAFNNDVYFHFQMPDQKPLTGYKKIDVLLDWVREKVPASRISFLGNAATLYKNQIEGMFAPQYCNFLDPMPETCSIDQIALMGYEKWENKQYTNTTITPLYLKQYTPYVQGSSSANMRRI